MLWWHRLTIHILLVLLAGALPYAAVFSGQKSLAPIAPGETVEVRLAGGESRRQLLSLDAGAAVTIVVVNRGIDLIVRVFQGERHPVVAVASDGPDGETRLRLLASGAGQQTIEVAAAYDRGAAGSYTISAGQPGAASPVDRQVWEAAVEETRARRLQGDGRYADALSHAKQALALRQGVLEPEAPAIARSLLLAAELNDALASFAPAGELYAAARAIVDGTTERNDLLTADVMDRQAAHDIVLGRFRDAESLAREALAICERILGRDHPLVARSLGTLADLHHESAAFKGAMAAAERAHAIAARWYEPTSVAFGEHVNRLARAELAAGNFARAGQLYRESLEASQLSAGPDSLAAVESLTGLARVALLANDNVQAEQLHVRTLAAKERIFGSSHPQVARDVFNLALIHYRRLDYTQALDLYARAVTIWERTLGRSHPSIALADSNIGLVHWRQGDYPRAEAAFQRALELSERLHGPDSLRVVNALSNLGIIAKETGDYALAEARYTRALAIREQHLGASHPDLIALVESLGILARDRGDYPGAEEWFRRSLGISEAAFGPEHPVVARNLDNIAHLNWAMARTEQALAALQRLLAIEEHNLPLNLGIGSERQKLAYFEPLLRNLDEAISFHVQHPTDAAEARALAITTLLQRKGRVLDALADSLSAFRARAAPDDRALLDQFARVTADLSAAALTPAAQVPAAERKTRAAKLAAERERLENEIHRRSLGYLQRSAPVTLEAVQATIPADAALLEFAVFRPFDPRGAFERGDQFGAPRYIAYVLRSAGEPQWKDLGTAEAIDRLIDRFRSALADPSRADVTRLAGELHARLLSPLEPYLDGAKHLLISPDGALNLVPFEALRSVQGRYLVEQAAVSYVTTGRDLVRLRESRPASTRAVVFADPAFGDPGAAPPARSARATGRSGDSRRILIGKDGSPVHFAPLAGTATEAQRIQALFPDIELRLGVRATENALKAVRAPAILHIATHGFFLPEGETPDGKASAAGSRAATATARIENPLLRSGLALAGANLSRTGGDDGMLTALEASHLDLWGTRLVTLSACDTGVGVVRNGEGVYGLRRAVFLAGAETLVMSLWPVSDLITREMMTGYYAGLKEGLGRGAALRRMQLRMLNRQGRAHPYYWASFIQAGEWAPLDGRR